MIPSVVHGWTVQRVTTTGFDGSFWVDGDKAVYVAGGEVFQYDGHQSTQISNTGGKAKECRASSGSIVWNAWDGHDYEMFLYQDGVTRQLTNNEVDDIGPDVSGSNVVWYTDQDSRIMLYDGSTTSQLGSGRDCRVCSGRVAWWGFDGPDVAVFLYEGGTVQQLTDHLGLYDPFPQVSDQYVMFTTTDLSGSTYGTVCMHDGESWTSVGRGLWPQLSGSRVVFETEFDSSGDFPLNTLALWDGSSTIQVPGTQGCLNFSPAISGDSIAWIRANPEASIPLQIMFYDGTDASLVSSLDVPLVLDYLCTVIQGNAVRTSSSMICWYQPNEHLDLYAAVIPEPSSLSLMGIALLALGRIRNRIRKA